MEKPAFAGYAFVHLMGHKTVVGYVHEETLFGTALIAVDVPAHGEQPARTDYYGPQSLYHLEPTTEDAVQAFYAPRPRLALAQARAIISEEELAAHDMATDGYGADGWPDPDAMEDPSPVEPDDPENDDTALMEG